MVVKLETFIALLSNASSTESSKLLEYFYQVIFRTVWSVINAISARLTHLVYNSADF